MFDQEDLPTVVMDIRRPRDTRLDVLMCPNLETLHIISGYVLPPIDGLKHLKRLTITTLGGYLIKPQPISNDTLESLTASHRYVDLDSLPSLKHLVIDQCTLLMTKPHPIQSIDVKGKVCLHGELLPRLFSLAVDDCVEIEGFNHLRYLRMSVGRIDKAERILRQARCLRSLTGRSLVRRSTLQG